MNIIFYAPKIDFPSSKDCIDRIMKQRFHIQDFSLYKNENGKPFLTIPSTDSPFFISVTHTKSEYFIAFSSQNVGIDAEKLDRTVDFLPILKKFPLAEREEISTNLDFLRHWTAKESAIKWLGGSIAKDFNRLLYRNKEIFLNGLKLPVAITQKEILGHVVSVCQESLCDWSFVQL